MSSMQKHFCSASPIPAPVRGGVLVFPYQIENSRPVLALYFGTSISGDDIPDIEGENEFDLEKQEVTVNEK